MGLDKVAACKQNAFEIHLDVSEIYFSCNLNVLSMGLDKAAGCKQNAFEIHLDLSEIYFRRNLNVFNHVLQTKQLGVNKMGL